MGLNFTGQCLPQAATDRVWLTLPHDDPQLILSLLLATMVFSVALGVKPSDFTRVLQTPHAVVCGLIPQFILLPVGTWVATLLLDLPPNVEVAMILVASCPGGSLSNVVTHYGRGNTALSARILAACKTPGWL